MFLTSSIGDVTVLGAPGELDARNAQQAKDFLKKQVEQGRTRLVIDMQATTFIDSSGLGALLTVLKAARSAGGDVKLCGVTPPVRMIFELTRLFKVFDSYPTAELAAMNF